MSTQASAVDKMGEIQLTPIDGGQLLKLDPNIPYIIIVPEKTSEAVIQKTLAFLGQGNVLATIIAGDPKTFRVFGSFPWNIRPQSFRNDPHPLDLPEGPLADLLRAYFISPLHDDAVRAEAVYVMAQEHGFTSPIVHDALAELLWKKAFRPGVVAAMHKMSKPEAWKHSPLQLPSSEMSSDEKAALETGAKPLKASKKSKSAKPRSPRKSAKKEI